MKIVSRAEWGAAPPKSVNRLHPDRVSKLVLHHTTGKYNGPATVRAIQRFHQETRNWADIGYNFLIGSDGKVYEGRGWDRTGAHARGQNSNSIGIAYIGDGRLSVPKVARDAILRLARVTQDQFGEVEFVGHRDVGSTVCPGDVLYKWWTSDHASGAATEDAPRKPSEPARAPKPKPEPCPTPEASKPVTGKRTAVMDGWMARLLGKR